MQDLKPCIESAALEIERLERQIAQMSELCLTVEEVNKIKIDAFEAGVKLGEMAELSHWSEFDEVVKTAAEQYANKVEGGE